MSESTTNTTHDRDRQPDDPIDYASAQDVEEETNEEQETSTEGSEPGEDMGAQDEFEALVENYMGKMAKLHRGQVVDARIVEVHREYVLVDIGDKSEAIVNIAEFIDPNGDINVKVGDTIPALIGDRDEETGIVEVSYTKARQRKAWDQLQQSFKDKVPVQGYVTRVIKGGVEVTIDGVTAFCPASQVDIRRVNNLDPLLNQKFDFLVLEINAQRGRAVVSRRALLEVEQARMQEEVWKTIEVGQTRDVVVKNIVEFGVFCDLGGLDGLIPREELSWDRGVNPNDFLKSGETIQVKVISVDRGKGKVSLSRRQMTPDPWETITTDYAVDAVVPGKVVGLTSYGAFVHLSEGVTGLLHAGDLTWDKGPKNPADYLKEGDHVKVAILEINTEKRQMALGLKQITMDPWAEIPRRFPVGSRHQGKVVNVAKFGAFVRLAEGVEGLVHISDMTWDRNVKRPGDVVKEGDELEVEVLNIDMKARKMSLSMKRLQENPLDVFAHKYPNGSMIEGKVVRLTDFGAFVEIEPGIDGLVHVSQISEDRIERPDQALKEGEMVRAVITKIERDTGKISLSIKDYSKQQEKKDMQQFLSSMGTQHGGHNLGDLLRNAAINLGDDSSSE